MVVTSFDIKTCFVMIDLLPSVECTAIIGFLLKDNVSPKNQGMK